MHRLTLQSETWPLRDTFRISRGAKRKSEVITVTINDDEARGRGEGTPYARYGESLNSVSDQIEAARGDIEHGISRDELQRLMPPGAARNAVDCALWDLEAKRSGRRAWELAGMPAPDGLDTAYSIGLDEPEVMARKALEYADWPLLKLKLTGEGDIERVRAVREAAPRPKIIVDANEAWRPDKLQSNLLSLSEFEISLIEQPLPVGEHAIQGKIDRKIRICADEACHTSADIPALAEFYDVINIKLDKTGGLTAALSLLQAARDHELGIMVGCMVSTSLSMAPAMLLATKAEFIDLDGPLLLAKDRQHAIHIANGRMRAPDEALWG